MNLILSAKIHPGVLKTIISVSFSIITLIDKEVSRNENHNKAISKQEINE